MPDNFTVQPLWDWLWRGFLPGVQDLGADLVPEFWTGYQHHWRSVGGAAVDLLLERDGVFHPFEIKMTANPTRRDASGLTAFRQSYPQLQVGKAAILCATESSYWITDDVAALPWNLL